MLRLTIAMAVAAMSCAAAHANRPAGDTKALIQSVDISRAEKEVAKEALADLLARLRVRGLPEAKVLSVVTEIARELIVSQNSSDQLRESTDSFGEETRSKVWRN